MHSGPVTAGVLRGERSRLQLFGDTMNITARIEATSETGRIHLSKDTADLLIQAGKRSWLEKRKDQVETKGKGFITTYWLSTHEYDRVPKSSCASIDSTGSKIFEEEIDKYDNKERNMRLVEWTVERLL